MQLPKENNYHPLDVDIATNEQLVEKESVLKSARDFFDDAGELRTQSGVCDLS